MSDNQKSGWPSWISDPHKKIRKLDLDPLRIISVKFGVDPCSHSREEVENVSANQRPGWPSWISDPHKK